MDGRTLQSLRAHAAGLPAVRTGLKWKVDWVACVGDRMFFVGGPEPDWEAVSFKVDTHRFLELTGLPGVSPAPYLARARWVQVGPESELDIDELRRLVTRSHALVAAGMSKKRRGELGL